MTEWGHALPLRGRSSGAASPGDSGRYKRDRLALPVDRRFPSASQAFSLLTQCAIS